MAQDFGAGVSRTLDAIKRQFSSVVWMKGKPPLDSELCLMSQIDMENLQQAVRSMMPSGFILDPTRPLDDYLFDPSWVNFFALGNPRVPTGVREGPEKNPIVWANVNGWIIPLCGTDVTAEGDLRNIIRLYPAPESDARIDFVFLEAWACRVDPNPATMNKPSASKLWKYGNVKYGGANLSDDIEDPTIGFETTARIQIQYRLRVFGSGVALGSSISLSTHPEGVDDPNVLGQGTSTAPVVGLTFTNMRQELSDPSLWRAGDGNPNNALGTVDGFTYAIPICAVFRRNSNVYVAVEGAGNPNQNGAFNRTPTSPINPLDGCRVLTTPTLKNYLNATDGTGVSTVVVQVNDLTGSGLDDPAHSLANIFLFLDNEIVGISAVDLINQTITIPAGGRGRFGSSAVGHQAGTVVRLFNTRPDGMFADQIDQTDVLDLRHGVNAQDWDYQRLLEHNLLSLVQNKLRATWKKSGMGDTQGVTVHEVDYLYADGSNPVPNMTEAMDGPDGVRTVWSDAATPQQDVTLMLDNEATQTAGVVDTFDATVAWDVGPDFHPGGFMNVAGIPLPAGVSSVWADGSIIFLYTGGESGSDGARGTFRDGATRAVRALFPPEYWKDATRWGIHTPQFPYDEWRANNGRQWPVHIRFIGERAFEGNPADLDPFMIPRHPGPEYPWPDTRFERPFIVLGSLLRPELKVTVPATKLYSADGYPGVHLIDLGIDFDASPEWLWKETCATPCSGDSIGPMGPVGCGDICNDPKQVTKPLNHGTRTLYGMLTANGQDITGKSSEVYVVLYGDNTSRRNNGVFKVIGVGQAGYTTRMDTDDGTFPIAPTSTMIRVIPLYNVGSDWDGFINTTGKSITVEFRAQYHNSFDVSDHAGLDSDIVIGLTDIGGLGEKGGQWRGTEPWRADVLGRGAGDGYDLSMPIVSPAPPTGDVTYVPSKMVVNLTLMYHPGRGAMARIPDEIERFAMKYGVTETDGAYLRQSKASVDPTFATNAGMPPDETYWNPVHIQMWNRLPAQGLYPPFVANYGGVVVGGTEQDREHELFIDRGSKSVIFRPFRAREMTLHALSYDTSKLTTSLIGLLSYPNPPGCVKDAMAIYTNAKKMGYAVPQEFMPRFGRQDIPYWRDLNQGTGPYLVGINHLFVDTTSTNNVIFDIIGGEPTTSGVPEVKTILFYTNAVPADYGKLTLVFDAFNNRPAYIARKAPMDIDALKAGAPEVISKFNGVRSTDLGAGLKGIQLPPYFGVARLLGVYTVNDYMAKSGRTFKLNRYQVEDNPAPNLLREDATEQTLFIMPGGALDLAGTEDDHTYIIPSNVIDITRALDYLPGNKFEDFQYVVVATVFGFARGFINKNNLVLTRKYGGDGVENLEVPNADAPEMEGIHMVIPCPAGANDQFYLAQNRTVYQGDPYMTRKGVSTVDSDYETRYGQLSTGAQFQGHIPIQQYDATGAFVPQIPNARAYEVLASMDFWTTMGTGKIGGRMYPSTPLDVCFTENSHMASMRQPENPSANPWRILSRTYTQGQMMTNQTRAAVDFWFNNIDAINPAEGEHGVLRFKLPDGTCYDIWGSQDQYEAALLASTLYPNIQPYDIFTVYPSYDTHTMKVTWEEPNFEGPQVLLPQQAMGINAIPVPGAQVGDTVIVTPLEPFGPPPNSSGLRGLGLDMWGWVIAPGSVRVYLQNKWQPPFEYVDYRSVYDITLDNAGGLLAAGASITSTQLIPGLAGTVDALEALVVHYREEAGWVINADLVQTLISARYHAPTGRVVFTIINPTNVGLTLPASIKVKLGILKEAEVASHTISWGGANPDFQFNITVISPLTGASSRLLTAHDLVKTITQHPVLSTWVLAEPWGDGVRFRPVQSGEEGKGMRLDLWHTKDTDPVDSFFIRRPLAIGPNNVFVGRVTQSEFLDVADPDTAILGSLDVPVNAGDGSCPIFLVGLTERLPLGMLLQDSDFLCEDPLRDHTSAMRFTASDIKPIQSLLVPTQSGMDNYLMATAGGEEYNRFTGEAGAYVAMSDATPSVLNFSPWRQTNPTGTRIFRQYRGGGPLYVLEGNVPGGPVDWSSGSISKNLTPVLKGGILVGRAMLIRNFYEEANPPGGPYTLSQGDEIQMVIATYGLLGDDLTTRSGLSMVGTVSPSGYGEGFAASDRYRIGGHPMFRGWNRNPPNPATVVLAPYPEVAVTTYLPTCNPVPTFFPPIPPFV